LLSLNYTEEPYAQFPGALSARADELAALLHWIPPRTTLVLCGTKEVASCREEIEMILLRLGVEVAYVCRTTDSWTAQPAGPACVFLL
jgi:hypothetical protein